MATDMSGLAWTPDGKGLVYGSGIARYVHHLWRVTIDGRHPPERLEVAGLGARRPAVVPSRDRLVFERRTIDMDIYRFGPTAPPRATIVSSYADFNASFSPDDLASSTPPHDRRRWPTSGWPGSTAPSHSSLRGT